MQKVANSVYNLNLLILKKIKDIIGNFVSNFKLRTPMPTSLRLFYRIEMKYTYTR